MYANTIAIMIIKCLVENTSISQEYKSKHGLSIYIETLKHKILFDVGPNGLFLENAKKLGIDITDIDISSMYFRNIKN